MDQDGSLCVPTPRGTLASFCEFFKRRAPLFDGRWRAAKNFGRRCTLAVGLGADGLECFTRRTGRFELNVKVCGLRLPGT